LQATPQNSNAAFFASAIGTLSDQVGRIEHQMKNLMSQTAPPAWVGANALNASAREQALYDVTMAREFGNFGSSGLDSSLGAPMYNTMNQADLLGLSFDLRSLKMSPLEATLREAETSMYAAVDMPTDVDSCGPSGYEPPQSSGDRLELPRVAGERDAGTTRAVHPSVWLPQRQTAA